MASTTTAPAPGTADYYNSLLQRVDDLEPVDPAPPSLPHAHAKRPNDCLTLTGLVLDRLYRSVAASCADMFGGLGRSEGAEGFHRMAEPVDL